jgi:hypothetical protein
MASQRRLIRLVALLGMIAVAIATPPALAAEQVGWDQAEELGADLPTSWFPEITADQTGTVWAVWETLRDPDDPSVNGANGSAIMLARLDEQGWSTPATIFVKDIYNAGRPILLSDGAYMHLLVRTVPAGDSVERQARMFHLRAQLSSNLLDARSWSRPVALSSTASYWAQVVELPDDALVVTYNQLTDVLVDGVTEPRMVLYSRRSIDHGATWTQPTRVSRSDQRVARNSLLALSDGTLVAAWDEGYDSLTGAGEPLGSTTAYSTDGGLTWEGHTIFRRHTELATLATDGELVLMIYRSTVDDALYYRESQDHGHSWSDELSVPGVALEAYPGKHNFQKLGVATDSAGAITVAYVGDWNSADEGVAVLTVTFAGGEWGEPVLSARTDGYPEYPRLAVALGNQPRLVFFVREDRFAEGGRNSIWTASGISNAPALEPQAVVDVPMPAQSVSRPARGLVQPVALPTSLPDPEPLQIGARNPAAPQATLDRPVLWVIAATAGAMVTILAMLRLWRSLQNARI